MEVTATLEQFINTKCAEIETVHSAVVEISDELKSAQYGSDFVAQVMKPHQDKIEAISIELAKLKTDLQAELQIIDNTL